MPAAIMKTSVRTKKPQSSTPHTKNHRWESFSTKISRLNTLDPLRRVRRHDLEREDLDTATSYLRNGLQRWIDLNITRTFADFRRKLAAMCGTLPQILHHQDEIMGLLEEYISKHDKESLEPLLDLLTAFAHDLGMRFEKYYKRSLELIIALVSKPQDVEVIEWSFGAMAWLFKYLSRLIVPNMRRTYDLLASLLGKERHPEHIARFAAEALSFLVRKAAAPATRATALVPLIVHVQEDLLAFVAGQVDATRDRDKSRAEAYKQGVMSMFAQAMKKSGDMLHSTAPQIFNSLLHARSPMTNKINADSIWSDVLCGILTNVVHHSSAETFHPLLEALGNEVLPLTDQQDPVILTEDAVVLLRLYGTAAGVRKGSRISDWSEVIRPMLHLLEYLDAVTPVVLPTESDLWKNSVISCLALCWIHAPTSALLPTLSDLRLLFSKGLWSRLYIPFCMQIAEVNPSRFKTLLRKDFQTFVSKHWSDGETETMMCLLLPRLIHAGALPDSREPDAFRVHEDWQASIVDHFNKLGQSSFPEEEGSAREAEYHWRIDDLPRYQGWLDMLAIAKVQPNTKTSIAQVLLNKLKLALRPSSDPPGAGVLFAVTHGLRGYLQLVDSPSQLDQSLKLLLRSAAPRFIQNPAFTEAYLDFEEIIHKMGASSSKETRDINENLRSALVTTLSGSSRPLRSTALRLLQLLTASTSENACLENMITIEQIELDHQAPRTIAVHLRRLAQIFKDLEQDSWWRRAIPRFLFGMLTLQLSPVWEHAVEALKQVSLDKTAEELIAELAFEWLASPSPKWIPSGTLTHADTRKVLTEFECLNVHTLQVQAAEVQQIARDPKTALQGQFNARQNAPPTAVHNARNKALMVFAAIPAMAEKRSRQMVPYLLAAGEADSASEEDDEQEIERDDFWSRTDTLALVQLFAKFGNPKVLYQQERAYHVLLKFLANRDIDMQKAALAAVLTWKQDGVRPYREHLENLLDEKRFKNELTLVLQDDTLIRQEHRQQLMPVLLRVLYGRAIAKKGAASGRNGLLAVRLAIIRNLSVEDLGIFLGIALGELKDVRVVGPNGLQEQVILSDVVPVRKQLGFLNMAESMIKELGGNVFAYSSKLVDAVLYCLFRASRLLQSAADDSGSGDDEEDAENAATGADSLRKVVKTTALRCLNSLLRNDTSFDWSPYATSLVKEVISPQIAAPIEEMAQGVSWIWRLLETLSTLPQQALLLTMDNRIMPRIVECFEYEKSQASVGLLSLGIVRNLAGLVTAGGGEETGLTIRDNVLSPHADLILTCLSSLLRRSHSLSRAVLEAGIDTVVELSAVVDGSQHAANLINITTHLLNRPAKEISPKIKGALLLILQQYAGSSDMQSKPELRDNVYATLSGLFSFFKDKQNRQALCKALLVFAADNADLQAVAALCADLNSYSEGRLDEPDYNQRLSALNAISRPVTPLMAQQWLPLVHNLVFFLFHDEEFGLLSTNSADGLCAYIDTVPSSRDASLSAGGALILEKTILPAIQSGVRNSSETVRHESVRVLGHLVARLPEWSPTSDLAALLPKGEEEDSFFLNILAPTFSKRLQAMQTLSAVNEQHGFANKNISQTFIPLLEQFIWNRSEGDDHGLASQASTTIASLMKSLEWSSFRALLGRFVSYLESRSDSQKQVIRLLDRVADTLSMSVQAKQTLMDVDGQNGETSSARLSLTMPNEIKFADDCTKNFLPPLLSYIHQKDEETVSARVPVAVIAVKLLRMLSDEPLRMKLPGVLTDVAHILRSKSWEAREMARSTLAKMACILGPSYFAFILDELRGALLSGPQLHVLSYTMHTLLLAVIPEFQQSELDYCLPTMVSIVMDDVFGATGQEKDADGYTTKMKEVKSSKSQDSMELLASTASITRLVELVKPLQALLLERLDLKMARKIDTLLDRVAAGLQKNPASDSQDSLVFCFEVVQEAYDSLKPESEVVVDPRIKRYLVQRGGKREDRGSTSKYTHKLLRFALDLLRTIWRKHDHLRTPANVTGFIPVLGDAVLAGEEEVKIAAFKLLTVLVRVPLDDENFVNLHRVAAKNAVQSLAQAMSTTAELSQTCLRLLSVILRDRREVAIKDAAIDTLLARLKDDLTEPQSRHITFNFLRCVLDRKVETATVYDTLDYVGTVMVTNDDKETRDLARGVFFQFLREYPQKKSRWAKQIDFILANLKYPREGGRLSIMEIVHLLLLKSADDFVKEIAATCFFPLVLLLGNDDSERCKLAAEELIREIFRKASKESLKEFLARLRTWLIQDKATVLELALRVFALYFEAVEVSSKTEKDATLVAARVTEILGGEEELSTTLSLTALQATSVLVDRYPAICFSDSADELWDGIIACTSKPTVGVKSAALSLLGQYLADFAGAQGSSIDSTHGVTGSHGQLLEPGRITVLVRLLLHVVQDAVSEESLATRAVEALSFLCPFVSDENETQEDISGEDDDNEEDGPGAQEPLTNGDAPKLTTRYVLWNLSRIIRKEVRPNAAHLIPKLAALNLLEALCRTKAVDILTPSLRTILRPLRNITDPKLAQPFSHDDLFRSRYETIKSTSAQIMEMLQRKLGTAEYTKHLLAVSEDIKGRRVQRNSKRKIEAVTAPDRWEAEKRKKMEKKKRGRVERAHENRARRKAY